jgi:hypothetical protein
MKEKDYTQAVEAYKDARAINLLMRKQGIITHWQKKMLKENPPKDDKRIRIRKDKDKKRSGQERQR